MRVVPFESPNWSGIVLTHLWISPERSTKETASCEDGSFQPFTIAQRLSEIGSACGNDGQVFARQARAEPAISASEKSDKTCIETVV